MTAVQTLPNPTVYEPKAERLIAPETPREETNLEWYRRWCRETTENRRRAGLPDESPITMEEIVAICKEARAERYAKKKKEKDSIGH